MIDDIIVSFEGAVLEPFAAHKLPDVFDRVQFGCLWRQRHDYDVDGHMESIREMPAGLTENEDSMGARGH
jgi:hypothetical protein